MATSWWARAAPEAGSIADVVDPEIEALPAAARAELATVWQRRGGLELRVAASFSSLAGELFEHGAPPEVYKLVAQAIRDEIHHAEISVELASRYRGDTPFWPEAEPTPAPPFAPTRGAMHATIYMSAMCCINETGACAVLEASMGQATSALVRAANRSILSDEIEHARAGWAYLCSPYVTAEIKEAMPQWLLRVHRATFHELVNDDGPLPGEDFPDHGMLSRVRKREVVYAALVDVVFPGFRRAGIDTSLVESWARGAFERKASALSRSA